MNVKYIYSGIRGILKHEGVKSLILRGFVFLLNRSIMFEDYYVVVVDYKDVDKENEADFLPRTDNYFGKAISTNQEADELVANGFELGAYELNLRTSLDKGAVAICVFVGKEFAHISCLADNPRGKVTVDPRPFNVDFQNGEIVIGKALTVRKFRNFHLRTYGAYILRKYCREKGIKGARFSLRVNNYPAMAIGTQPTNRIVISKCRFIKILWFKHLKEKEMKPTTLKQIYEQTAKGQPKLSN
jgi:hypothetical protein